MPTIIKPAIINQ